MYSLKKRSIIEQMLYTVNIIDGDDEPIFIDANGNITNDDSNITFLNYDQLHILLTTHPELIREDLGNLTIIEYKEHYNNENYNDHTQTGKFVTIARGEGDYPPLHSILYVVGDGTEDMEDDLIYTDAILNALAFFKTKTNTFIYGGSRIRRRSRRVNKTKKVKKFRKSRNRRSRRYRK